MLNKMAGIKIILGQLYSSSGMVESLFPFADIRVVLLRSWWESKKQPFVLYILQVSFFPPSPVSSWGSQTTRSIQSWQPQ